MLVIFYKNASNQSVVNKSLTQIGTSECQVWGNLDIEQPVLRCEISSSWNDHNLDCNYVYIPKFHRYYYASLKIYDGRYCLLTCKSDPIKSFWDSYKNSPCIAARSSSHPNTELQDSEVLNTSKKTYRYRKLSGSFQPLDTGYNYIVTVAGGGTSTS